MHIPLTSYKRNEIQNIIKIFDNHNPQGKFLKSIEDAVTAIKSLIEPLEKILDNNKKFKESMRRIYEYRKRMSEFKYYAQTH